MHAAPLEIVVAAGPGVDAGPALQVLRRAFIPNKVVALAPGTLPLLEGKTAGEAGVRVYVCRDYVCGRPLEGMAAIGAYVAEMGEGN